MGISVRMELQIKQENNPNKAQGSKFEIRYFIEIKFTNIIF
jgi:hypothetical protein